MSRAGGREEIRFEYKTASATRDMGYVGREETEGPMAC